jgi:hypothetical protein
MPTSPTVPICEFGVPAQRTASRSVEWRRSSNDHAGIVGGRRSRRGADDRSADQWEGDRSRDRAPYPDAIVEFKNTTGGNVHTTTDVTGEYSLQVPDDVYTAFALDLNNTNAGFDAVGGANSVSVPPSTRINFEAYPIVPGYGPVP